MVHRAVTARAEYTWPEFPYSSPAHYLAHWPMDEREIRQITSAKSLRDLSASVTFGGGYLRTSNVMQVSVYPILGAPRSMEL